MDDTAPTEDQLELTTDKRGLILLGSVGLTCCAGLTTFIGAVAVPALAVTGTGISLTYLIRKYLKLGSK